MAERVSVVVGVGSESARIGRTLDALRRQHADTPFEVILVVPEPHRRSMIIDELIDLCRVFGCPDDGRSAMANLGAANAAGGVVAFLSAGAAPDNDWLGELVPAFDGPEVGGVGGVVFDPAGNALCHEFGTCDRLGQIRNVPPAPPGVFTRPSADPHTVLHPSNCAFRRDRLAEAGGFDELLETDLAFAEVCLRLSDRGVLLRPLRGAPVFHAPEPDLREEPAAPPPDPARVIRDRSCFALRYGRGQRTTAEVLEHLTALGERLKVRARVEYRARRWPSSHVDFFCNQIDRAFGAGVELGLSQPRRSRDLGAGPDSMFRAFPTRRPSGTRRTFCFIEPKSGGVGQLAVGAARAGHTCHLFVPGADDPGVRLVDGVWVHSVKPRSPDRWDHATLTSSHRERLAHADAVYEGIAPLRAGRRVDLIVAAAGDTRSLFCRRDGSMPAALIGPRPEPMTNLQREVWADGRDVLRPTETGEEFLAEAERVMADRQAKTAELTCDAVPRGTRLRVSMIGAFIEPRDATSNVYRQQIAALWDYAEANDLRFDLRAFVLRSRVDDPRVWSVPDVAALALDPFFLSSDLIVYHFGYYNPLFESMPLAPRSARRVVNFYGITPPELFRPERRGEVIDSFRQMANLPAADQIIVQSRSLGDQLRGMGVSGDKISRVPLSVGFPMPETLPVGRRGDSLRLAYVGRFVPSKGVQELLDAVALMRGMTGAAVRLDLCGNRMFSDPAYLESLKHAIRRRGLTEQVRFHFDVSDSALGRILRGAEVFVMPSHHEGFCVPVIEALFHGCRIVSSDAGALPETCAGLGLTYPSGDATALADRLKRVWDCGDEAVVTDGGVLPAEEWRAAVTEYIRQFTASAYAKRFCEAVFREFKPSSDTSRVVSAGAHRQALLKLRDGLPPGAVPTPPSELLARLTGEQAPAVPVAGGPVRKSPRSRLLERLQAARCRIRRIPVVGGLCRYVKRAVWLPWNFHNLYQEIGQHGSLRRPDDNAGR